MDRALYFILSLLLPVSLPYHERDQQRYPPRLHRLLCNSSKAKETNLSKMPLPSSNMRLPVPTGNTSTHTLPAMPNRRTPTSTRDAKEEPIVASGRLVCVRREKFGRCIAIVAASTSRFCHEDDCRKEFWTGSRCRDPRITIGSGSSRRHGLSSSRRRGF